MAKLNIKVKETKGNTWKGSKVCSHRNMDYVMERDYLGDAKSNMVRFDKRGGVTVNGYNSLEELIYDYRYD